MVVYHSPYVEVIPTPTGSVVHHCEPQPVSRARIAIAAASGASIIAASLAQHNSLGEVLQGLLIHQHQGEATRPAALGFFLVAIALGAAQAVPGAIASIKRLRLDMNALVIIAIAGAGALGAWMEAATVAFLYALSQLLEAWSHARRPHDHTQPVMLPGFIAYYTPVMISIAALTVLLTGSFYRALIVLMDSCPCALLIAAPIPLAVAAARSGDRQARMHRIIYQNIAVTIGIKVMFLVPTVLGKTMLWMALATDQGAVLFVTLNGLRLLRD